MSSYHNLVVSSAQADRSELAGYRVSPGAKAEITQDAICRELGNIPTSRFSRPTYRFGLLLAASVALAIAGIHGASAQSQPGMFADADGIEPPDMGVAYSRTPSSSVAAAGSDMSPEMAALLADADGMEPPDSGFAIAWPVRSSVAAADRLPRSDFDGLTVYDDGIEPPDMGIAYDTDTAYKSYVERQQRSEAHRRAGWLVRSSRRQPELRKTTTLKQQ